jgi:catechol 2,3-dioxygenase-like lactoylglutathione lyase family enzyme
LSIIDITKVFENASNATPIIKSTSRLDNAPDENPDAVRQAPAIANMQLDHATIVTADLDHARRFFVEVAGLTDGARPPFSVAGHWLYANGRPVLHLIDAPAVATAGRTSPRIDHLAFRLESAVEWQALLDRLHAAGVDYQTAQVPQMGVQAAERQLFVALAPGVVIEFVTALPHAQRDAQRHAQR